MGNVAIRVEHLSKKYEIVRGKRPVQAGLAERISHGIRQTLFMSDRQPTSSRREEIWPVLDVSFEVEQGDVFAIIGRNGAGKSTLLKLLSRITEPTSGRAQMYGRVGTLLEVGTGFHPELSGRDNIYLSGIILGMKKTEIDRVFEEIVDFSGIEKYIDMPVKRYSSGMYVRLAFAVGAHLNPEILIVDEVLSVGDYLFQQKCLKKMSDIGEKGRTVIFVSHDMSSVARLCNKAILLDGGRCVREGSAHEIVGEYLYSSNTMTTSHEWEDPHTAPGNEIARLRAVRVKTGDAPVKDTVDLGQPIGLEIEFDVLQPGHVLTPCVVLNNEEGVILFEAYDRDPTWLRRPKPAGKCTSTAWIPEHLLRDGTVIVTCAVITEVPFRSHCVARDVVAFHLHESGHEISARGDYSGKMSGVVRPLLKWTTIMAVAEDT